MVARIVCEVKDGVAQVTLSYPKRFNAMSRAMWRELRGIFEKIQTDTTLRCVLVRGQGDHFCAGGDISEYASFRFDQASLRDFHEVDVWGALRAMLACDVPMVAQIAGHCMGAGVEIASCCDIRLSAESARFGAPIAKLGFPMAPREVALVGREVGLVTARQMLLEAAVFSAPQMLARGFLSQMVPEGDLATVTAATLQRLIALAPQAARLNKQTLRVLSDHAAFESNHSPVDAPLALLLDQAYCYADSAEHREGIRAFLEKRPAHF
ncbi:MAG: enoyl-CoA hydratase [Comamonadaceae bacterium CG1_02_60_18]|nr:MAG: enoyl-CoA hydratase [Comamonadaceae bacterium CG1_02_60_18]PIQ51903.1 MAG: enoyl-CoA hydratase [Comamonadaceae bacterium CG12_big_fil_rev_8_21_14_0_65_59_15]